MNQRRAVLRPQASSHVGAAGAHVGGPRRSRKWPLGVLAQPPNLPDFVLRTTLHSSSDDMSGESEHIHLSHPSE